MKILYTLGILYLVFSISLLFSDVVLSTRKAQEPVVATRTNVSGNSWFEQMRPHCNALEIDTSIISSPAPDTAEGQAYAAACFGMAGKIDKARAIIDRLAVGQRAYAAGILFGIAHPIADRPDDRSAGPMIQLTVEYQPDNYMALYHAGISESMEGKNDLARKHLTRFLELYQANDYFTQKAKETLELLHQ